MVSPLARAAQAALALVLLLAPLGASPMAGAIDDYEDPVGRDLGAWRRPDYAYWFAGPQVKQYATTPEPPSAGRLGQAAPQQLTLSAARGEAEGRQLMIRPIGSDLTDIWIEAGELSGPGGAKIAASNASVYKVGYVTVKYPSYGYSRVGPEPDPLVPLVLANGKRLGWRPGLSTNLAWRSVKANVTQPFYVLFRVPDSTAPGTYSGTVRVSSKTSAGKALKDLAIPVTLTVHPFSIEKRTLKTSFGINLQWAMYTNSATHAWLGYNPDPGPDADRIAERSTFKADQIGGWLRYLSEHRVTPQTMLPAWENGSDWAPPADDGKMKARRAHLDDYLGTGSATTYTGRRLGFNTIKVPEYGAPSYMTDPFASSTNSSKAATYLSSMTSELGSRVGDSYAYPVDEPPASKRSFVERYAGLVHRYAPGVKYFVTVDGKTMGYKLLSGVDIYGQKLHHFYRDYGTWIKPIKNAKKGVWIYSHATTWQKQVPNYLIDQPLTSSRAQGWYVFKTRADGLLYFNVSAWRPTTGSSAFRDPYKDPLSYRSSINGKAVYANGDGSLVYPGYYPAIGLVVQGAPPVGSLRMEAIRDGIEDYEYLKLVEARYGTAKADAVVSGVVGALPAAKAGVLQFPPYQTSVTPYEKARTDMATLLSQ